MALFFLKPWLNSPDLNLLYHKLQCQHFKFHSNISGKINFAVWELEIHFLSLLFYFSETQTCPLFASRESLSVLVSHWGGLTCCQRVRQETTIQADSSHWWNSGVSGKENCLQYLDLTAINSFCKLTWCISFNFSVCVAALLHWPNGSWDLWV